ncbi:alpha-galactosidase [Oricola sp.]|uniref:alpha-galactosidase n=1 Tax=Oricola sp. TaxID=1979950 RepID=UPI003BA94715
MLATADAALATQCWRIDAGGRCAVFASFDGGVPALIWFGPPLPRDEQLEVLASASLPNVSGGQLDPFVPLTLCPVAMTGWQGNPGIAVENDAGEHVLPELRLARVDVPDETTRVFHIEGRDAEPCVSLRIEARLEPGGLLSLASAAEAAPGYRVRWLAAATLPVPQDLERVVDHAGRWCGEFRRQETRFATGQIVRDGREGRTGHAGFPGARFLGAVTGADTGRAMGATLAWSGGHTMVAEELPDGRRYVQFGPARDSYTNVGDDAPSLLVGWSEEGENGLTAGFHAHVRGLPLRPVDRPVHYNCWEAVYFRHDLDELKEIATLAADIGAERFVLDDGWFKGRNDDTTSLGDWTVDPVKFPDGLHPLTDHVRDLGMRFGIWFEPEMISRDSDLYRAHPDWVLGPRAQPSGRNQFVLDLRRPGVTNYLFDVVSGILADYPVDYVKWDHNRMLTGGGPDQTVELYRLLARLRDAHPDVDFESCASGGGRIDYGILAHAVRVWLSDSNDALERLRMQHEAARWLPPEFVGSHVGPRVCHTSGRILPMAFRAWVAAQRHMGFEMDPRELTPEEAATLKRATAWWRENRAFLFSARQHLLHSNDPEVFAEILVDEARDRFVVFKGQAGAAASIAARRFALSGLDPDAIYAVRLIDADRVPGALNRYAATGFMHGEPVALSGRAMMYHGLPLPNGFPCSMLVVEGRRLVEGDGHASI